MKIRCKKLCYGFMDRLWNEGDTVDVKKGDKYPSHFEVVKRAEDEEEAEVPPKDPKPKADTKVS